MKEAVFKFLSAHWTVVALVLFDIVIAAGTPWVNTVTDNDAILAGGAAVIAVATFLGVWLLQRDAAAGRYDRNSMRDGIAAAFVVTYLVIVSWSAFFAMTNANPSPSANPAPAPIFPPASNSAATPQLSPLTQAFIGNFTILTGVVVGGYFGADALKQVTQINARSRQQNGADSSDGVDEAEAAHRP
jgi:hypothetical protein